MYQSMQLLIKTKTTNLNLGDIRIDQPHCHTWRLQVAQLYMGNHAASMTGAGHHFKKGSLGQG